MELQAWHERLNAYLAAEAQILRAQEYTVGPGGSTRRMRRAELAQVQAGIRECQQHIQRLGTRRSVVRLVPL